MSTLREFFHADDLPVVDELMRLASAGPRDAIAFEHRPWCASGEWKWMLARARVVERNERREATRIVGTCADITDRKRAEQALSEVDRRRQGFLAVLSHELRNPLAAARGARDTGQPKPRSADAHRAHGLRLS
jgi:signal transduction histidine kinase